MVCKGTCVKYKTKKIIGRYLSGKRWCSTCAVFMQCNNIRCFCCGYSLRTHPRNKKYKEKFRELKE